MNEIDELDQAIEGENFAVLFERTMDKKNRWLDPGEQVTGRILKVSSEWIFLDTGQKGEGVIDRKEFNDLDGTLTVKEGDSISAYFLSSKHGEMHFTTRVGAGSSGSTQLEDAWQAGVPVEGLVEKEIKGGYEIKLGGTARAFCPFSQISLRRVENPETLIGTRTAFLITDYGSNGRTIIVSRRALLEVEQQKIKDEAYSAVTEGQTVSGTVTSLQDYGAFVDIGGVEGLLPVAEVGWSRVKDVREVLSVGQELKVKVKSIDRDKGRISLSLKDTQIDPWDEAEGRYTEGSFHFGIVARMETFGAFVSLSDGVDGLIHISRLGAGKRINHPREVLKEGESIEVRIESFDHAARRLSLVPAGPARAVAEEEATLAEFRQSAVNSSHAMGTLGEMMLSKTKRVKR